MTTAGRTAASARFAWRCAVGVAVTEAGDCVCVEPPPGANGREGGKARCDGRERREAGFPRGCGTAATLASDGHCAAEVDAMTVG